MEKDCRNCASSCKMLGGLVEFNCPYFIEGSEVLREEIQNFMNETFIFEVKMSRLKRVDLSDFEIKTIMKLQQRIDKIVNEY